MTQIDAGDELSVAEHVFSRTEAFRAAHALVKSLTWGGDTWGVYDVLQVARYLETGITSQEEGEG